MVEMDEIKASTLPTKVKSFYPPREIDVVLVPKSRNYPCDDLYKKKTTRIAMIDPTGFRNKNNMNDLPIEHEIDLEQNKMYAKRLLAEITALSRPYKDAREEAKRQKHFQWLYNRWIEAEYTVSKDRVRLMLKSLIHHDTTVLPMLTPHKDTKKQWSYVMYKRFMANKDELLFETQAMNHWPARIPWTIPFDLLRGEKLDATKMSQRVQALFTQILYNVPHTWNNTKLMELVDLGRKIKYEFKPNDRIRKLGDKFDYPESSIRTGFVWEGKGDIEKEIEVEGSDTKTKKTKHVKFEVVVGWLDANVCYGWHNPATNGITRNAIHQCMSRLFTEIYENDKKEWEHVASVFAGVSVKITEYKPVTIPEPEHTGDAPQYDSQCHVLCVRPFGGPDHCHVSNIYFKNQQYHEDNHDIVFGILNTGSEKELEHLSNNAEYIHEHHTIQPYVMQDRAKLAEHQLAHINVKAHSRHWILKENGLPLDIKRRISKLLEQDAEKPEQLLRNFKAARITFQDWDLLVSTMTDDENTAHTVITAVNYPHHHSHFPSLGSSFHSPVHVNHRHSDIIELPPGAWYEIRYVTGSLDDLRADSKGHSNSVFFWDLEEDRKGTKLVQEKIHEVKKQMYKDLEGVEWPLNTPFHKALLTQGAFLELWQKLTREMIKTLITGQLKHHIAKLQHEDGDAQLPKVSLEMGQGAFFSIQYQKMKDALKEAGMSDYLLEIYETLSKDAKLGDSNMLDKSQKYNPEQFKKGPKNTESRGRQAGANHTSRNSSEAGSNPPSRDTSRGRDSRGSSQARGSNAKRYRRPSPPGSDHWAANAMKTPSNVWQQSGQKIRLQARHEVPGSISLSSQPRLEENNAILLKELLRRLDNQA